MKFEVDFPGDSPEAVYERQALVIGRALVRSAGRTATYIKALARADIANAGFSERWQKAVSARVYPENADASLSPVVYVTHRIPYADVFEEGLKITGNLLWVPLDSARQFVPRGRPIRPENVRLPLVSIELPGRDPLLAVRRRRSNGKGYETIPVFVGKREVQEKKRFHFREAVESGRQQWPSFFEEELARGG